MNNDLKPINTIPNFKRFCMTIGELPTSYLETMTYYEMLVCFTEYMKNTIIPTINNNGLAVEELQNKYIELKSYVDNYFTNLDVQEEINNKLDQMAQDGTLQEIITSYLNSKAIFGFDTINDMKQATNLIDGSYAKTLGYYEKNDGGGALYKINNIGVSNNEGIIELNNGLKAHIIITDNKLNLDSFGAKGNDSTYDNGTKITDAIKYCVANKCKLYIPPKTYYIKTTIDLYSIDNTQWDYCVSIIGYHKFLSRFIFDNNLTYGIKYTGETLKNFEFENIRFECETKSNIKLLHLENSPQSKFKNLELRNCSYGLYQTNCWLCDYENIRIANVDYGIYIDGFNYTVGYADMLKFDRLYLGGSPTNAGLYLKGCVNANLNNIDAENSNKGHAIVLDSCKNIEINGFYVEGFLNLQPIKITSNDFTSLDRIPSNITINNINAYNTVSLIRLEACLNLNINDVFYRNKIYNETITSYEDYPLLLSIKSDNRKYIGTVNVNGYNFIEPIGSGSGISSMISYNNLIYTKELSTMSYLNRTFIRGQKIIFTDNNRIWIITDDGTFSANPSATLTNTENSFYGTLSANDENLFVGQFVNIGTQKARVIKIDGLTVYFDRKITTANMGQSITTCNPTYKEIIFS